MKTFTRDLSFINFTDKDDNVYNDLAFVNFNGVTVFESWRQLIKSGVPPLTLQKCKSADLVDYRIYGEIVQNGTPTPETPIEIESVGDKTKNLVKYPYYDTSKEQDGLTFIDNGDGSITINGTATKNTIFSLKYKNSANLYDVFPNETYTISLTGEGKMTGSMSFTANYYYSTGSSYSSWLSVNLGKTKTGVAPENLVDLRVYLYCYANATFKDFTVYPQIVKGETIGEWKPYGYEIPVKVNDTITNIYLNEPLRKIGDYVDYIDFENKKVVRKIQKIEIDGSWTWTDYSASNLAINANNFIYKGIATDAIKSNYGDAGASKYRFSNVNYNRIQIHYNWLGVENLDGLKAKLIELKTNGKPFIIYYPTNGMPKETIELPNILLDKGTNIIDIDTTIKPSNLEIKYYGKGKLETLNVEDNTLLNSILSTDNETKIDIFDSEINNVLNEIIGG